MPRADRAAIPVGFNQRQLFDGTRGKELFGLMMIELTL